MENTRQNLTTVEPTLLAKQLGYAGLLPFVTLALMLWLVRADLRGTVATALAAYASVIAAFLGGIHWGIAQRLPADAARFHLMWGVMPSLVAWLALVMPADAGLTLLGLTLLACYFADRHSYPRAGLSAWLPMRLHLTLIAVLSCAIGAMAIIRAVKV